MSNILISHQQAAELLFRIVAKHEKKKFDPFIKKEDILKTISTYSKECAPGTPNPAAEAAKKIFKDDQPKKRNIGVSFVRDLARSVKHSEPIILASGKITAIKKFLQDKNYEIKAFADLPEWTGPDILTCNIHTQKEWTFYHYDKTYDKTLGEATKVPGILRGKIELEPFGRAKLFSLKALDGSKENYTGIWRINNDKYLKLKLKLNGQSKDLNITVYVGDQIPTLTLGSYYNYEHDMFSGAIMIIPLSNNTKNEAGSPAFVKFSDRQTQTGQTIPEVVWDYFFNQTFSKSFKVKHGITSEAGYWLEYNKNKSSDTL